MLVTLPYPTAVFSATPFATTSAGYSALDERPVMVLMLANAGKGGLIRRNLWHAMHEAGSVPLSTVHGNAWSATLRDSVGLIGKSLTPDFDGNYGAGTVDFDGNYGAGKSENSRYYPAGTLLCRSGVACGTRSWMSAYDLTANSVFCLQPRCALLPPPPPAPRTLARLPAAIDAIWHGV